MNQTKSFLPLFLSYDNLYVCLVLIVKSLVILEVQGSITGSDNLDTGYQFFVVSEMWANFY